MMKAIYLIGPYGCGKTSTGKELAKLLKVNFIDADDVFKEKFGRLDKFLKKYNWLAVVKKTSEVLRDLPTKDVVIAQALFRDKETENIKLKDAFYFKQKGILVLILPSKNIKKSVKLCFEREVKRDYNVDFSEAVKRLSYGIPKHKEVADIIIYDNVNPKSAAKKIFTKLKEKKFYKEF